MAAITILLKVFFPQEQVLFRQVVAGGRRQVQEVVTKVAPLLCSCHHSGHCLPGAWTRQWRDSKTLYTCTIYIPKCKIILGVYV